MEAVYSINFNQNGTCLAVGTNIGYKLFSLDSVQNLSKIFELTDNEPIEIIEPLDSTKLITKVNSRTPKKLMLYNLEKSSLICSYDYPSDILSVKLNKQRFVVSLNGSFWIQRLDYQQNPKLVNYQSTLNPRGLFALCAENSDVAYPTSDTAGIIQIFSAADFRFKTEITAHENPISALAFNTTGNLIATASIKGTIIRVFDVETATKQFEFRRGLQRCVNISCLAFSADSRFLCASSDTETVHVFKLTSAAERANQGWLSYFGEQFAHSRAFAIARLPTSGSKTVCTVASIQNALYVYVASTEGYLCAYNLDGNDGGECTLLKQYRIDDKYQIPKELSPFAKQSAFGGV